MTLALPSKNATNVLRLSKLPIVNARHLKFVELSPHVTYLHYVHVRIVSLIVLMLRTV